MKNETSYQSFSEQQSKELKTIERRIDFHLAKNPKNGFQNNIIPQSKLSSNGKKIESLNKNKSSNELFDPKIIEEMISWNKVRRIGPGFFNLGNSCFLNSTLQCLLYIPPLTQVLLDENLKVIKTDSYSNQLMLSHFQR
jgi:ubiquitin carboxyl-terminal hydrolase 36/42